MTSDGEEWVEEGYEASEGAQNQHSDEQESLAPDSHNPDEAAETGTDDGGDYDPESVTVDALPSAPDTSASTPQRQTSSKPKMSGGFLVEASDDEEEDSANGGAQPHGDAYQPGQMQNGASAGVGADQNLSIMPLSLAGVSPAALFEARINEDPRGDMEAWLNLIADYRRNGRIDDARGVYNRFVEVFPHSADIWADWIEMELGMDNFVDAERIFGRCLMLAPNVRLWTVYLNYIRRRNDLNNDPTGQARQTVTQSYEFVIDNIGMDRDSGNIWQDYVQFIRRAPGEIGGTGWQDQQKMDQLRKVYHRAITVPTSTVNNLWKEFDQFEMGLNKVTGRRFIQERSPGYMSAKSANIALDNITRSLQRTTLARLPPAPGFDGDAEFHEQVELWKKWIAWEKDDPLVLQQDEPKVYKQRVLYCYKQALMALRFWPEIWVDAAEWCFKNDVRENEKETGTEMLLRGIAANPESVLIALKHADHVESTYPAKEGDRSEYAKAVQKPYDDVLNTLYAMGDKAKDREKLEISTLMQAPALNSPLQVSIEQNDEDDDGEPKKSAAEERILGIQRGNAAETQLLSKVISYVWIALARAMRRIQGKGSQTEGGLRKVFTDARHKGRLTSDVYVAVALLESVVYKDPVGAKIFERGARLFPNDEMFMIEYLKYLHSKDDTTNARVIFETCVNRLISKPETLAKARPMYAYFHKYESQYGELSQVGRLEDRMAELFPHDPKLACFAARFSSDTFDPVAAPIIISKAVQMRPKQAPHTIEQPASAQDTPAPMRPEQNARPQYLRATASPKRPLGLDEEDINPPKRLARGVSPLKGAAGRRLDQQRRNQATALHRDITFLLGILPPAHSYDTQRFNPSGMVGLLRNAQVPDYNTWKANPNSQRMTAPTHGRQPSGEFLNRPSSPYGRMASSASGYRNSPLRTESTGQVGNPYATPDQGSAPPAWAAVSGSYAQPPPGQYGTYRF